MSVSVDEVTRIMDEAELIFSPEQLEQAISGIAAKINAEMSTLNPVVISLLKGGLVLSGQLLPHLDFPLEIDYIHATRYRDKTEGGSLHWIARQSSSIKDRTVLLLDDIFDEGHTLAAIHDYCIAAEAKDVFTAVLLDKSHDRKAHINIDFVGLEVPDRYVFGYGMDYKGYLRNANGIYAVRGT